MSAFLCWTGSPDTSTRCLHWEPDIGSLHQVGEWVPWWERRQPGKEEPETPTCLASGLLLKVACQSSFYIIKWLWGCDSDSHWWGSWQQKGVGWTGKEWNVSWAGSTFGNDGNPGLVGGSSWPLGTDHWRSCPPIQVAGKEQGSFNAS